MVTFAAQVPRTGLMTMVGTLLMLLSVGLASSPSAADDAASATKQAAPRRSSAWQPADCVRFKVRIEDDQVECGYVSVPRRHADPAGPAIRLATVIIKPQISQPAPEPLFIAQGGPGGSSIDSFAQMLVSDPDTRPAGDRDLIVWDQRGTLFSEPALTCPEVSKADLRAAADKAPDKSDEGAAELSAYRACGERLTREAGNLSDFNTMENANDIEALRVALGYGDMAFYGVSYGSELGQYLIRQHPGHLRAAVLDAVVPTDFSLITDVGDVQQRIARKYFDACRQDPRCDKAFPNLGPRFLSLVDRLNKKPVELTVAGITNPLRAASVSMDGEDLSTALYQALYIRQAKPLIPYIIDRADKSDFSFVSSFLLPSLLMEGKEAEGMYMSVLCAEHGDTDPNTLATLKLPAPLAQTEQQSARTILQICRDWHIELLPRFVLEPVKSDVPTLLLSGEFDPITPPALADRVAAGLSHSVRVVFPSGTHGQAFESACSNGIIQRFLDDPGRPPDAGCASAAVSRFVTPADLIVIRPLRDAVAGARGGVRAYALRFVVLALGLGLLATAVPVYALVEVIAILSGRRDNQLTDRRARFAAAAPWLPVLALVLFVVAAAALTYTLNSTFAANELLTFLGAVPSSLRWVFILPLAGTVVVLLMIPAARSLWKGHRRSFVGRLYYGVLLVAGLLVVSSLLRLGLLLAAFA